jgi:hypothetical protein
MRRPSLTLMGRILKVTGCCRVYRDGDGAQMVFRWWHPVSWLVWLALLPVCGLVGDKIGDHVPFRLSPYWRERRDRIEWL